MKSHKSEIKYFIFHMKPCKITISNYMYNVKLLYY